jgi:hypothetical protein
MTSAVATAPNNHQVADRALEVLVSGNLSVLTPPERLDYYNRVCESLGVNPLTKPFEFLTLNGKLVLYALKSATDQLREIHGVSIDITGQQQVGDLYMVTVTATNKNGRQDSDMGVVSTQRLQGENLANAILKAITKAKRRVTLSICGLGMLDETEVEDIPAASKRPAVVMPQPRISPPVQWDTETGEAKDVSPIGWGSERLADALTGAGLKATELALVVGGEITKANIGKRLDSYFADNPSKTLDTLIEDTVAAKFAASQQQEPTDGDQVGMPFDE